MSVECIERAALTPAEFSYDVIALIEYGTDRDRVIAAFAIVLRIFLFVVVGATNVMGFVFGARCSAAVLLVLIVTFHVHWPCHASIPTGHIFQETSIVTQRSTKKNSRTHRHRFCSRLPSRGNGRVNYVVGSGALDDMPVFVARISDESERGIGIGSVSVIGVDGVTADGDEGASPAVLVGLRNESHLHALSQGAEIEITAGRRSWHTAHLRLANVNGRMSDVPLAKDLFSGIGARPQKCLASSSPPLGIAA